MLCYEKKKYVPTRIVGTQFIACLLTVYVLAKLIKAVFFKIRSAECIVSNPFRMVVKGKLLVLQYNRNKYLLDLATKSNLKTLKTP